MAGRGGGVARCRAGGVGSDARAGSRVDEPPPPPPSPPLTPLHRTHAQVREVVSDRAPEEVYADVRTAICEVTEPLEQAARKDSSAV